MANFEASVVEYVCVSLGFGSRIPVRSSQFARCHVCIAQAA